ncbi:MAG: peptidoglycan-binding domain-containing protein [Pseudomonadota bacterium]
MSTRPLKLHSSVGRRGRNIPFDVRLVQERLNELAKGRHKLKVTGRVGARTLAALWDFQKSVVGFKIPDTKVDMTGKTIEALETRASAWKWAQTLKPRPHGSIYNP